MSFFTMNIFLLSSYKNMGIERRDVNLGKEEIP